MKILREKKTLNSIFIFVVVVLFAFLLLVIPVVERHVLYVISLIQSNLNNTQVPVGDQAFRSTNGGWVPNESLNNEGIPRLALPSRGSTGDATTVDDACCVQD